LGLDIGCESRKIRARIGGLSCPPDHPRSLPIQRDVAVCLTSSAASAFVDADHVRAPGTGRALATHKFRVTVTKKWLSSRLACYNFVSVKNTPLSQAYLIFSPPFEWTAPPHSPRKTLRQLTLPRQFVPDNLYPNV